MSRVLDDARHDLLGVVLRSAANQKNRFRLGSSRNCRTCSSSLAGDSSLASATGRTTGSRDSDRSAAGMTVLREHARDFGMRMRTSSAGPVGPASPGPGAATTVGSTTSVLVKLATGLPARSNWEVCTRIASDAATISGRSRGKAGQWQNSPRAVRKPSSVGRNPRSPCRSSDLLHHPRGHVDRAVVRQAGDQVAHQRQAPQLSASCGFATSADSTRCCWSGSSSPSM